MYHESCAAECLSSLKSESEKDSEHQVNQQDNSVSAMHFTYDKLLSVPQVLHYPKQQQQQQLQTAVL